MGLPRRKLHEVLEELGEHLDLGEREEVRKESRRDTERRLKALEAQIGSLREIEPMPATSRRDVHERLALLEQAVEVVRREDQ